MDSLLDRPTRSPEQPTAICIEDQAHWRAFVTERVSGSGLAFSEILATASVEEAQATIRRVRGPLLLFIDLRFEDERVRWDGFLWILDELGEQIRNNPRTIVFVISGNLDNVAMAALESRGIDPARIFKKSRWADEEETFLHQLRTAVENSDWLGVVNMQAGNIDSKVDVALFQHVAANAAVDSARAGVPQRRFPFLVRARSALWSAKEIPDLELLTNIGTIFACRGTIASLNALQADADVLNVEASPDGADLECEASLSMVRGVVGGVRPDETGDQCIVALIDTGIDVLHEAFLDDNGRSRILAIWDQTDPSGPPPAGHSFGTFHNADAIASFIVRGQAPLNISKGDHGTHVASIAAGRPTPHFSGGVAPGAVLVIVIPDASEDFGYSNSHLAAVKFITEIAEVHSMPVVINVSLGTNAGAHDGTSNLEISFDLATNNGIKPGVVIVKSAGNERIRRGHAVVHAKSGAQEILSWESSDDMRRRDVIEGWFKSSDRIRFRLCCPGGKMSAWVGRTLHQDRGYTPNGAQFQLDYVHRHVNGDSRIRIQLDRFMDAMIDDGVWSLEVEGEDVRGTGVIDFWVTKEMSSSIQFTSHTAQDATLTVPATARHVLAIGSVQRIPPTRLSESSSLGPTRDGRQKPELVAPGHDIVAAASLTRNDTCAQSGTSMAAPHVTGAIALAFSKQRKLLSKSYLNASQVYAALTQSCQQFNGQWHKGLGYGLLDIDAFLRDVN